MNKNEKYSIKKYDSIASEYDTPDDLFLVHQQKVGLFKDFVFRHIVRHLMNGNIKRIRNRI